MPSRSRHYLFIPVCCLWVACTISQSLVNQLVFVGTSSQLHASKAADSGMPKITSRAWNNYNGYQQSRFPIVKTNVNAAGAVAGTAAGFGVFVAILGLSQAPAGLVAVLGFGLIAAAVGRDGRFNKPIKDIANGIQRGDWRPDWTRGQYRYTRSGDWRGQW